jgi:hypothetical protein
VEPGVGRLLRFRDPERNIIELVSQVSDIEHGYEAKAVTFEPQSCRPFCG